MLKYHYSELVIFLNQGIILPSNVIRREKTQNTLESNLRDLGIAFGEEIMMDPGFYTSKLLIKLINDCLTNRVVYHYGLFFGLYTEICKILYF